MNPTIAAQLLRLNREFYQTFAAPFSASRGRLQPGVLRALDNLPPEAAVLDLGCGNGGLAVELLRRGHRRPYVGLDSSAALLETARSAAAGANVDFRNADLSQPGWGFLLEGERFGRITSFATLHHLPGAALRRNFLNTVCSLLAQDGRFIFSVWDFLQSERLRRRILPWSRIGLQEGDVDPGDHLLDWRRGGTGIRYVHYFSPEELEQLAAETGWAIEESYQSDGEGGRLGRYQTWKPLR